MKRDKKTFLFFVNAGFLLCAAFLFRPANAAEQEVIVYSDIKGQYSDFAPDFRALTEKAIDNLSHFKTVPKTRNFLPTRAPIADRLKAAVKEKVWWLAEVTLTTEKNKAMLSFAIYNTINGESTFRWSEEYKVKSIKSLLAQLEYNMPIQLKTRFFELGRVIKKEKRHVYFDLGDTAGIKPGDLYQAYRQGDEIEDEDGNSYGYLEVPTGVVKIVSVTSIYSVAEIVVGQLAIEPDDFVRPIVNGKEENYKTEILSVLENQVAINIGKSVGVKEGSYYAIYRDIKKINNDEAFRLPVGHIKVNEIFDDFSKGELSISETYDLAKYTIQKGDRIVEVESPRKNMWSINQVMTNVNSDTTAHVPYLAYQRDSVVNVQLAYRLKAGYGDDLYFAAGVMQSLKHSSHVFAGIDLIYLGGTALNMFVSVDIDTPLSNNLKLNLESGYTVSAKQEKYGGINTSVGLKYGFDLF